MPDIYMYNVYFGDCFRIDEDSRSLVVDFGMRKSSKPSRSRSQEIICDEIWEDLCAAQNKRGVPIDMLVTHFHEDHIYGLTYRLALSKGIPFYFDTFYMPDIFSGKISTPAVSLILLGELLSGYYLNDSRCNLCELCKFLCKSVYHVRLLKRGDLLPDYNYTVLWPDIEYLKPKFEKVMKQLSLEGKDYFQDLFSIAADLSKAVINLADSQELPSSDQAKTFTDLQQRLEELQSRFDWKKESSSLIQLKDIGNWASIVFHNAESCEDHFLFTGDAEASHMRRIIRATDIPMYAQYKYIKLPHHGTESHYVDFRKFEPKFFMAPSGMLRSPRSGGKIYCQYSCQTVWTPITAPHMFCSNSGWCEMADNATHTCECGHGELVFPPKGTSAKGANKKKIS